MDIRSAITELKIADGGDMTADSPGEMLKLITSLPLLSFSSLCMVADMDVEL